MPKIAHAINAPMLPQWVVHAWLVVLAIGLSHVSYAQGKVPAPPARPLPTKLVFAHYMVCCPTVGGGATIEDYKHEIQEAQSRGIDGFALNNGGWDQGYKQRTTMMYEAARQLGTGFKLFISADYCCGNGLEETRDMVESFRNHPNQFRYDGKPVLSSFAGEGTKALSEFVQREFQSHPSKEIVWVPYFYPKTYHEHPQPADVEQVFHDYPVLDGYYYFGAVGNGDEIATSNHLLAQKWLAAGKIFMADVSPYYRSFSRLNETQGFKSMAQEWEGAIRDGATWIEITTWNDWAEKTYVAPFGPPGRTELWGNGNSDFGTINYSHVAYLDASRYYIDWFKTGIAPQITEDKIFYFYRTEPKAATGKQFSLAESKRGLKEISGAKDLQDKVFVTCFLTKPAQLIIHSGTTSQTFNVQAGMNHIEMPFALGVQRFVLARVGQILLDKTGEQTIVDRSGETRYNYFAGEASVSPIISAGH